MDGRRQLQDLNSVTCGIFQIYFYDNFFSSDENSKIQNQKQLNKKIKNKKNKIKTLLNELFILDDQETNEATIRQYTKKNITVI